MHPTEHQQTQLDENVLMTLNIKDTFTHNQMIISVSEKDSNDMQTVNDVFSTSELVTHRLLHII